MTSRAFARGLQLSLLGLLIGLTATGCGGMATVSGTVKYKNKLLKGGSIQFQASNGTVAESPIGSDGTYTAKVPPGPAKVAIGSWDEEKAKAIRDKLVAMRGRGTGKEPPKNFNPKELQGQSSSLIPEKYADFTKSGLELTIKSGVNSGVNFELE